MKKPPGRIQNQILDLLIASARALDKVGGFAYHPYPYLYSSLGDSFRKESINEAAKDLVEKGLVEGGPTKGLRLTSAGASVRRRLIREQRKEWDGKWRVVFFDIPETQRNLRDSLRSELKGLGFGLWQRSTWVTPFDIAAELNGFLEEQNLSERVQIVVGERVGRVSDREFAAQTWPLEEINKKYSSLLSDWENELQEERSDVERFQAAKTFNDRYLEIFKMDPQLPPELLSGDWVGDSARKLFEKLKSILAVNTPF